MRICGCSRVEAEFRSDVDRIINTFFCIFHRTIKMRSLSVLLVAMAALVGLCCANYGGYYYAPYSAGQSGWIGNQFYMLCKH